MKVINPYEKVYQEYRVPVSPTTTLQEAQQMSRQLSMLYNTFGMALKDLVGLLAYLYEPKNKCSQETLSKEKEHDSNSYSKSLSNEISRPLPPSLLHKKYSKVEPIQQEKNEGIDFDKYAHKLQAAIQKPLKIKSAIVASNNRFERIQVPRGRRQRQALNGYSCIQCQNFYKALGEEFSDNNGTNRLCDGCSRHRSNLPPTNYFTDFSQEFGFED